MTFDQKQVDKIAHLARLHLTPEENTRFAQELNKIMHWIEQLSEVDTQGVEPVASVVETRQHWRKDVTTDGRKKEDVLANAPERMGDFFVVPKVIE